MELIDDINRSIRPEHYDEGYESWRQHMSSFAWCVDSGRFGSAGDPGISDLDTVLIVKDGELSTSMEAHRAWLDAQPPERQFLFVHSPVIVPLSVSDATPVLHTVTDLKWDRGERLGSDVLDAEVMLYTNLMWTLFVMPHCVRLLSKPGPQSLRNALSSLKNLLRSESFWNVVVNGPGTRDPLSISRELRQLAFMYERPLPELARSVSDTLNGCALRVSRLLDTFGDSLIDGHRSTVRRVMYKEKITCVYGKIIASHATDISAQTDMNKLHHMVFDLVFHPGDSGSFYHRAAQIYWSASARMRDAMIRENQPTTSFYPKPFNYEPVIDDADLDYQDFACPEMPTAIASRLSNGGRSSTGATGYLVYGPYVRIRREGYYYAKLNYATVAGMTNKRAGVFDIVVTRFDRFGDLVGIQSLAEVHLRPTDGASHRAYLEFETKGCVGMLLETRVFVDPDVLIHAFSIRVRRLHSEPQTKVPWTFRRKVSEAFGTILKRRWAHVLRTEGKRSVGRRKL